MKTFAQAVKTPQMGTTYNGMATFTHSGNALVDLYSAIGSSRGKDITPQFAAAYAMDRVKALKIILWARDIRGGSGDRQTFRNILRYLESTNPDDVEMLLPYIPFFGRWDDLLIFKTDRLRHASYSVISEGLTDQSTAILVKKWLPRKGKTALELEKFLELQPTSRNFNYSEDNRAYPGKAYRKMLSNPNLVETLMCSKKWDEIKFEHVPSLASARYQKAFNKHCAVRYTEYKASLKNGTTKINAAAVYPYDVIKSITKGDAEIAQAQWDALPNFLGDEQILALVDVSGSMNSYVGGKNNLRNIDVAVSLGLYVADKAKGPFKDVFLTFSGSPTIQVLTGNIVSKYTQMVRSHWSLNTNLMAAFQEILKVGKTHGVADADMPKILLILSDMEFDACVQGSDKRAMEAIREMYKIDEYTLPKVVFWNLNARAGNSPVQSHENGTALVSGFSPAIMKSILKAQKIENKMFTPESVMEETINNPRYDVIDKATRVSKSSRPSDSSSTKRHLPFRFPA